MLSDSPPFDVSFAWYFLLLRFIISFPFGVLPSFLSIVITMAYHAYEPGKTRQIACISKSHSPRTLQTKRHRRSLGRNIVESPF